MRFCTKNIKILRSNARQVGASTLYLHCGQTENDLASAAGSLLLPQLWFILSALQHFVHELQQLFLCEQPTAFCSEQECFRPDFHLPHCETSTSVILPPAGQKRDKISHNTKKCILFKSFEKTQGHCTKHRPVSSQKYSIKTK